MSKEPRLVDYFTTHRGCVRAANEDSLASLPRERVWVVADGMGGHSRGQYASQKVATAIETAIIPEDLQAARSAVKDAIVIASDELYAEAQSHGQLMGSTVVSLIIRGCEFVILSVGDSRAYLHRGGVLRLLTRDHTQVQEMLDRGIIEQAEAKGHPLGHVLTRAIGAQPHVAVDTISDSAEIGDIFLLCSDGLYGVLTDEEISRIIATPNSQSAEQLVEACLERGAPDNVTVTLVQVSQPTGLTLDSSGAM